MAARFGCGMGFCLRTQTCPESKTPESKMRKPERRRQCRRWLDKLCDLHRMNGPAVEYYDGSKEWWSKGVCFYAELEFGDGWERLPIRSYLPWGFEFPEYEAKA